MFYWARIILLEKQIIFSWNWYAKDIVFLSMRWDMFDNFNKWYLEDKMKYFWASKKDIKFYLWMLDFYNENKSKF